MLVSELITKGSKILRDNKISSHLLDSELIMSRVLNLSREKMLILNEKKVSKKIYNNFYKIIDRRSHNEPLAYLFKEKEFWSKKFYIDKKTLIPRPETELMVEFLVKHFRKKNVYILDIGTGSGCILLAFLSEIKSSQGVGIDISKRAINNAKKNAKILKLYNRIKFLNRSLEEIYDKKFDVIVSNPPYISSHKIKNLSEDIKRFEPRIALDGGNDGLDVIKKVIYKSSTILKRKGILALEIGNGQFKNVSQILKKNGFRDKFLIRDYRSNIRGIISFFER